MKIPSGLPHIRLPRLICRIIGSITVMQQQPVLLGSPSMSQSAVLPAIIGFIA